MSDAPARMTFWEHLDELRAMLLRSLVVIAAFSVIAFMLKDALFGIVLAPKEAGFVTYRLMADVAAMAGMPAMEPFHVELINTGLAEQFVIHMKTALCFGVLAASPYIIYLIFGFVAPGLYANEKRYAWRLVSSGYIMYMLGMLLSYFLIFPLTFRFLGTYQVAGDVTNMITLQSYMSTLIVMSLTMGIVFEIPVLAWLLGKCGLLTHSTMKRYRRHAIVVIVAIAAIITPTSDVVTLALVSLPMLALYETSILLVKLTAPTPATCPAN